MEPEELVFLVKNMLRTDEVKDIIPEIHNRMLSTEYDKLMTVINSNMEPFVKTFARGLLLVKLSTDHDFKPEFFGYLKESAVLASELIDFQGLVLSDLNEAAANIVVKTDDEVQIFEILKIVSRIKRHMGDDCRSAHACYMRVISEIIYPFYSHVLINPDGNFILSKITRLHEIQELGFKVEEVKTLLLGDIIDFIKLRNKMYKLPCEIEPSVQTDYEIIELLMQFNCLNEDDKKNLENLETELGKIEGKVKKVKKARTSQQPYLMQEIKPIDVKPEYDSRLPLYSRKTEDYQVSVFKAKHMGKTVAVKEYRSLKDEINTDKVLNEIRCYQALSSHRTKATCFLEYFGSYAEERSCFLVMEYQEKDLMNCLTELKRDNLKFNEQQLVQILFKLLVSFAEMETLGIYHGDIKPHNMLVDERLEIKIIDFGISAIKQEEITDATTGMNPLQGTQGYRAPEVEELISDGHRKGKFLQSRADVFSLGMTFLQIILMDSVVGLNTRAKHTELMKKVDELPYEHMKKLLRGMLCLNPRDRKRFRNLAAEFHPVFTKTVSASYSRLN